MKNILGREQRELEQQYREEKHLPEAVFIQEALNLLQDRMVHCGEALSLSYEVGRTGPVGANFTPSPPVEEVVKVEKLISVSDPFLDLENILQSLEITESTEHDGLEGTVSLPVSAAAEADRPRHHSSSSDDVSSEGEEGAENCVTAADLDISSFQPVNLDNESNKNTPKSTFYFYQDANGQLLFLHALNIQMLMQEYGSFENSPHTIMARILEKDSSTMTSELRDRLRYLRHLPVSSTFDVAELDLSNLVSKNTLLIFKVSSKQHIPDFILYLIE